MDNTNSVRRLPDHVARAAAVGSGSDPRTVQKVFAGNRRTLALVRDRIVRQLREMGIEVPEAAPPAPTTTETP